MWTAVEEKNMEAIDPCSYEHYLSSSKNKAWKSSGPYEIWVKFPHSPILHYAFSSWTEKTMTKTIHFRWEKRFVLQ